MCIFYFIDHKKSSRLNDKENDQFKTLNCINKTMFHSFELNQTRSSAECFFFIVHKFYKPANSKYTYLFFKF